jgi:RNA ligase
MNYKFPVIRHISDVLPHIEGRDEFIVAERDFGFVVNYVVAMADTFDMTGPDDLGGAIRRECRGLIFDRDGNIMSRPFHKFFNVNERAETQTHEIDMSQPHVIMEKMDGSMIRPILVDGYLRLATKMGVTNVAMEAEAWLATQDSEYKRWLHTYMNSGYTPLFEWVSPFNQIVLAYEIEDLVLLAIRDNVTGEYVDLNEELEAIRCPFTVVRSYGSMEGNLGDYIERLRKEEGREGIIGRFNNGHMFKGKNDWYVRIHKTIDRITFDRNIVDLIINEEVDDVIPMLPTAQVDRIRNFETRFWAAFRVKEDMLLADRDICSQLYEDDRKRIALEYVPTLPNKADAQFVFRMLDGHNIRDLLLDHIRKSISTNTKWDVCAAWLDM